MALNVASGTFAPRQSTGTQSVTGLGFQPKVVLFIPSRSTDGTDNPDGFWGFGCGISSTQRCSGVLRISGALTSSLAGFRMSLSECISYVTNGGTPQAIADFVSCDADGFTINWTTAQVTAKTVGYLAIGGDELTNAVVGSISASASTGNVAVTGVGFKPDSLIVFAPANNANALPSGQQQTASGTFGWATATKQGCNSFRDESSKNPSVSASRQSTSSLLALVSATTVLTEASLVSLDTDGFTLNWTTASATAFKFLYIALKGAKFAVGSLAQPTATGNAAVTGVGFTPAGLMLSSIGQPTGSSIATGARRSTSFIASTTKRFAEFVGDRNGVSPTQCSDAYTTSKAITLRDVTASATTSILAEADLASFDSDGFTLNWTTADATQRIVQFLAVGSAIVLNAFDGSSTTGSVSAIGDLSTSVQLAASCAMSAAPAGDLSTQISLAGQASALGASPATDMALGTPLAAVLTISLAQSGDLTTSIELGATAQAALSSSAALDTGIMLAGAATGTETSPAANLATTAIYLAGVAAGAVGSIAALSTAISLEGASGAQASAPSAPLSTGISFAASLGIAPTVTGALSTAISLIGLALGTLTSKARAMSNTTTPAERTYRVAQESRLWSVPKESRVWNAPAE